MNKGSLLLFVLFASPAWADWGLALGGGGGDGTERYQLGVEWNQGTPWIHLRQGQLGYGLWFDSSYWQLDDDDLATFTVAPVLKYSHARQGLRPFAFVGVGPAWISQTRLGNRELSTQFQFSSRAGLGVALNGHSLALEGGHLSNSGIKEPNDGLSSWGVNYRYNF
ncbi:acyloxyacyl hydrolase [Zobellella maritima]|uniref:acyloxyacyl hydrolase n=1 Tax=Zobellella maritima TaxID=2059725 RepID=UPI000E30726B|nr:acyloxyacyl hydrolase [Zobellella maritima]